MSETHLSDQEILRAMDGELSLVESGRIRSHLESCWTCRTRRQELDGAIADFVRFHQADAPEVPPTEASRALLKAQLREMRDSPTSRSGFWLGLAATLVVTLGGAWMLATRSNSDSVALETPNRALTPGAAVLADKSNVCQETREKNREVPASLQRKVFEAYGIAHPEPADYEVDYLITPALGGAEDIHNLWPQPHARITWNAEEKDKLEDRLRDLVCSGQVELATAQHEIAVNWIEAYKKYFQTDSPVETAR